MKRSLLALISLLYTDAFCGVGPITPASEVGGRYSGGGSYSYRPTSGALFSNPMSGGQRGNTYLVQPQGYSTINIHRSQNFNGDTVFRTSNGYSTTRTQGLSGTEYHHSNGSTTFTTQNLNGDTVYRNSNGHSTTRTQNLNGDTIYRHSNGSTTIKTKSLGGDTIYKNSKGVNLGESLVW